MSNHYFWPHRGESRYNSGKGPARKPGDKKRPAGAAAGRGYGNSDDGGRGRGRGVSLRIGSGKKGGSDVMQRRGTLKRRDRSRDKALKEERAIERRTVFLPG